MKESKIEWTDHTFNPWVGCTKVSPGCANCYAETLMDKRYGWVKWGRGNPRQRASASYWRQPHQWNLQYACGKCPVCGRPGNRTGSPCECGVAIGFERPRVFCASLADWLDDEVPAVWLADLLDLIRRTPNLDWLLLTKRPENWVKRLDAVYAHWLSDVPDWQTQAGVDRRNWICDWTTGEKPPPNVWLGVSAEDQQRWRDRVSELVRFPAAVRFVSVEPMLGPIEMHGYYGQLPDWVIFGGESGPGSRPCNVEWIRDGLSQCRAAGVAPFVKQVGSDPRMNSTGVVVGDTNWPLSPTKVQITGAPLFPKLTDRKGGDPAEWPEDLRVREWPMTQTKANL